MAEPDHLVDIHCHLLPEIDDGAADWEESLAMAQLAAGDGITTIIATPHQLGNYARNDGQMIRDRCACLAQLLSSHGVELAVLPGADVRIDPELIRKIRTGDVVTLADRRQHVLLELPHELYLPLDRLLHDLKAAQLVGILSHPERNQGLLCRPKLVEQLVDAGCLMQLTAGSLMGTFGPEVKRFAESLLVRGLVHFVATDAHGPKRRRPLMRRAFRRIAELLGSKVAIEITSQNPARVVAGQPVAPGRRNWNGRRPARWLPWRRAG